MQDRVKDRFKKRAILHSNIWMYFITTAYEVVDFCEQNNLEVFSLEAFRLTGEGIQPSMANSIDIVRDEKCWERAKQFLDDIKEQEYLYEIWYEGC